MDLQLTRQKVMGTEDVNELYELELDLTEYTGKQHKNIMMAESTMEQGEAKSNLSLANALLGICRERQADVKNIANRINYNFRMAAKVMLKKETYDSIYYKAQMPRREFKLDGKELRANKLPD